MTPLLLIVLAVVAVVSGRVSALAYAFCSLAHWYLCATVPDRAYYVYAGAFDLLAYGIVAIYAKPSRTATAFLSVCGFSIALNFYGLILYLAYYPPVTYNFAFVLLYCVAIYLTLRKDPANDECSHGDSLPVVRDFRG